MLLRQDANIIKSNCKTENGKPTSKICTKNLYNSIFCHDMRTHTHTHAGTPMAMNDPYMCVCERVCAVSVKISANLSQYIKKFGREKTRKYCQLCSKMKF